MSLRIKALADLVPRNAKVIDIGTDHAYLPVYLYECNITKDITATDISSKVLEYSKKTLQNHHLEDKIRLIQSDGFNNVSDTFDVAVIAGMGTNTILHILDNKNIPNTLIIETHNDYALLRKEINSMGYKIEKEIVIKVNKKYYPIIKYVKGKEKLSEAEVLFGKSLNIEYLTYLNNVYERIYKKSHKQEYANYLIILNELIEKILDLN